MRDYEQLFAEGVHQKLKDKIIGKVFVKVTKTDALYVKIISYGNLTYELWLEYFSDRILNSWTSEYAVYEIMKQYRSFINQKYFT